MFGSHTMNVTMLVIGVVLLLSTHVITANVKQGNTIHKRASISSDTSVICVDIKFVDASRKTNVRKSVLTAMCEKGIAHTLLEDKLKQFAVFNIHRDDFDPVPKWISGDAKAVVNDPSWEVNEITRLPTTGYQWYSHGYPAWPLPHQALAMPSGGGSPSPPSSPTSGRKSPLALLSKKPKIVDWPNYGFATPVYFASNAWRNQAWSLDEFFQDQMKNKKSKSEFKDPANFHKLAKVLVQEVDTGSVESYNSWPFLQYSLVPMIESMFRRNKGLCPDEVYIFTRMTPCHPKDPKQLTCTHAAMQARNLLTQANCRSTQVIQGYSQEYSNDGL